MEQSVFCIVPSEALALTIVNNLRLAGFRNTDVSVLFPDHTGAHDFARESTSVLGWLAGIAVLALPDAGPHVAAGPILSALGGAAGATAVGIVAALEGMGISEHEARRYEAKIREGNILLSVQNQDRGQRERAREILRVGGGREISPANEVRPEHDSKVRGHARAETR